MKPLIIGIAGGTGSGKSTVARKVAEALPDASVAFLEMDAYYRDFRHLTLSQLHHGRRNCKKKHPPSPVPDEAWSDPATALKKSAPTTGPKTG